VGRLFTPSHRAAPAVGLFCRDDGVPVPASPPRAAGRLRLTNGMSIPERLCAVDRLIPADVLRYLSVVPSEELS